jgi:magnesium-transporting ATPase (P-type)
MRGRQTEQLQDWRRSAQSVTRAWNGWLAAEGCDRGVRYWAHLAALADEERAATEVAHDRASSSGTVCRSEPRRGIAYRTQWYRSKLIWRDAAGAGSALGAGGATMGRVVAVDQACTLSKGAGWSSLALVDAAALPADEVLWRLESTPDGLSRDEARAQLARVGANALRSDGARPFVVLLRQLRNPLLILLVAAAVASFAVVSAPAR